jgi:drug/metabolite transporter (DMT)-like permease
VSYLGLLFLMGLPAAIADWRSPESLRDLGLMIGMGLFSGLGNILVIYATRAAPAAIVSSFMYTQLVWGCLLGLALFGDTPDRMTLLGAAVIIGCGLYTLSLASRRARALVEPA